MAHPELSSYLPCAQPSCQNAEALDSFFVYMGMEECLILDKNSFVEGTDINFKELLTAVAGLKKEENGDEYEK